MRLLRQWINRTMQMAKPARVEPVVELALKPQPPHPLTIDHSATGHYRDFSGNVVGPEQGDVDEDASVRRPQLS
jgi:hypothetical protein